MPIDNKTTIITIKGRLTGDFQFSIENLEDLQDVQDILKIIERKLTRKLSDKTSD